VKKFIKYSLIGLTLIIVLAVAFVFFVVFTSSPGGSFFGAPPDLPAAEAQQNSPDNASAFENVAVVAEQAPLPVNVPLSDPDNRERPSGTMTICSDPRPKICTQDYRPVCGERRNDEIQCVTTPCPKTEWKTYSNGCTACADPLVTGYHPGSCEAPLATH